jgi:hypothetical protein
MNRLINAVFQTSANCAISSGNGNRREPNVLEEWVSEKDAAAALHKTVRTLRQWRRKGVGPPPSMGITPEDVAATRAEMEATGRIARPTGKDGKVRTAKSQQEQDARRVRKVKVHISDYQPPTPEPSVQQVQPATAEDIGNQQTIEHLALRVWAAIVAGKVLSAMSDLMDELIQSTLLVDDDDEEADEYWLDDHHKREKKLLDEAIADALDKYSDIDAVNNLPPSSDPAIARDAEQLRDVLTRCLSARPSLRHVFHSRNLSEW